jgi:drug/metabolite transporter (DMT)-like permease
MSKLTVYIDFLQPAVVASLGSAALVFNFFFAYLLVGTKITRMDILATFLIIIGSILVAVFGDIHKDGWCATYLCLCSLLFRTDD